MPFQKGQSGNPQGRAVDKPWRDALRKAVSERDPTTKRQYIQMIAESVRGQAMTGDVASAKEIGDRLDGRAAPSPEEREDAANILKAVINVGIAPKS